MTPDATRGAILGLAAACGVLLMIVALTSSRRTRSPSRVRAVSRLAVAADLPRVTTTGLVMVSCASAAVLAGLALIISAVPAVAVICGVLAAGLPLVVLRRRAAQRETALRASWPDAVDALVSGVRAGMSLPEALGALAEVGPAPLRPALAQFVAENRATGSFSAALDVLSDRLADPVADRVLASLRIARDVGGSDLGRVLRTLSTLLREDATMRGEIAARQSWTVSAARMAVAAPWITLALLCTRPEAAQAYRTTVGACVLVVAALTSVIAYRLMMRIGRLPTERRMTA